MGVSSDGILVFGIELGLEDEYPEFLIDEEGDEIALGEGEPVELVIHCSYDYPMYVLAVPGTKTSAWRGYPHSFTEGLPTVTQEQIDAFKAWAAEHDVEGEPCWILSSLYG